MQDWDEVILFKVVGGETAALSLRMIRFGYTRATILAYPAQPPRADYRWAYL